MRSNLQSLAFVLALVFSAHAFAAGGGEVEEPPALPIALGAPFRDNAVLQREMNVPVWGWSKPGTKVTVTFAGQSQSATAGEDGKWVLTLAPLKASFTPAEMTIAEEGGKSVTLKNILVGEVWMASGQSNMQWKMGKTACVVLQTEPVDGVAPIREFEVTSVTAQLHPIAKAEGSWKNGNYENYSAIAYAFAHKIYGELKVPVGILNCSWSQTQIQAWIPREGYASGKDEYTRKIHQLCLQTDPSTPEFEAAWSAFYKSLEDQIKANDERVKKGEKPLPVGAKLPGNMRGNRDANWLFNARLNPVIPFAIRGAIWNQGYANMGEGMPYYNNLHSLIRGWRIVWDRPNLPVYFHQFYSPGNGKRDWKPTIGSTAEMRLGTTLARDIPNAGMASQIDIQGAIHYGNKAVPGQRLALHALKNQYGKDLVVEGPMYKSNTVDGDKVIIEFENAEGGLVVANSQPKKGEPAYPQVIDNGDDQVGLFSLAGEDKVWHPAKCKIEGGKVIVTSDAVKTPRGVAYGTGGVGFVPSLYNTALLPMTPFIYYDNKMVTQATWPEEKLKIAGETIDPNSVGLLYEWRKMPILPPQFRENAVLQAGVPITVWGSTQMFGEWGGPAEGEGVIHFEFGDIKKTIPVTDGMDEWNVTLPAMAATSEPRTMTVSFTLNGELAHKRVVPGIVFGDVIYVAAPSKPGGKSKKKTKGEEKPEPKPEGPIVRMLTNNSKRSMNAKPSRFSVCVSRTPKNRFAAHWKPAIGLAASIGKGIAAKTGKPVGIIYMNATMRVSKKETANVPLSAWMAPDFLKLAPSLMGDYKGVGSQYPGNPYYNENVRRYISDWKKYWGETIPAMIRTKAVPDGSSWGHYPSMKPKVGDSKATQAYNISVHCFSPAALSAIVFLTTDSVAKNDQGANFAAEMAALAKSFKTRFGGEDVPFIYTMPGKGLAAKITPTTIDGASHAVPINAWDETEALVKKVVEVVTTR
jgi:sialate O-acetylesterase